MNSTEIAVLCAIVIFVLGIFIYKYYKNLEYAKEVERQTLEAQLMKQTNMQGKLVDTVVGPNLLDKTVTEQYPDELGFPEPSGKGVRHLEPEPAMIDKYYKDTNINVPVNNKKLPIGACPFSRPMSRDLPVANVPMCMATRDDSDMRLH
jgi:hypothetical protein